MNADIGERRKKGLKADALFKLYPKEKKGERKEISTFSLYRGDWKKREKGRGEGAELIKYEMERRKGKSAYLLFCPEGRGGEVEVPRVFSGTGK